jgi:hypothetical protein
VVKSQTKIQKPKKKNIKKTKQKKKKKLKKTKKKKLKKKKEKIKKKNFLVCKYLINLFLMERIVCVN